jgi:hypothetical protein
MGARPEGERPGPDRQARGVGPGHRFPAEDAPITSRPLAVPAPPAAAKPNGSGRHGPFTFGTRAAEPLQFSRRVPVGSTRTGNQNRRHPVQRKPARERFQFHSPQMQREEAHLNVDEALAYLRRHLPAAREPVVEDTPCGPNFRKVVAILNGQGK